MQCLLLAFVKEGHQILGTCVDEKKQKKQKKCVQQKKGINRQLLFAKEFMYSLSCPIFSPQGRLVGFVRSYKSISTMPSIASINLCRKSSFIMIEGLESNNSKSTWATL